MPRHRNQLKSYNISKHRYMELYYYCMQYNEWLDFLKSTEGLNAHKDEGGRGAQNTSMVENIAIKRAETMQKCKLVEQTAEETDKALKDYIVAAVTEGYTYNYLVTVKGMPCGRNLYYKLRRKFYYLLSKKV